MPAEVDLTLPLRGLPPVCGEPIVARFDGGRLSWDGGILLLAEVERRLGIADQLARCVEDPRVGPDCPWAGRDDPVPCARDHGGLSGCERP